MSRAHKPRQGYGKSGATRFIRNNASLIVNELPPPGEEWIWRNQNIGNQQLLQFKQMGIIKQQDYVEDDTSDGHYWTTNSRAYEVAEERLERDDVFPCGHARGFTTVDAENGVYECRYERCNSQYDRETVMEVLGDE